MNRLPSIRSGLACCLFALVACSSAPKLKVEGTVPVVLTGEKKTVSFAAEVRNEIVITLPPPKEPGYRWEISFHDVRYLKQASPIVAAAAPDTGPSIKFIALMSGRTRLRFALVPDTNERVVKPLDQQDLVITID